MPIKLLKKLKNLSQKSVLQTTICKVCFKDIKSLNIAKIFNKNLVICSKCASNLRPVFIKTSIDNIDVKYLYKYCDELKSLLYQLKGCGDYEISSVFLCRYLLFLKLQYSGYILVPAPSYYLDDERRGFNHVEAIFRPLGLKIVKCFEKVDDYKQSDQKAKDRINISKHIKMSHIEEIQNKKILLVDDVFTTGNTLKCLINFAKEAKPKKISVLVLAKVDDKQAINN